METSITDSGIRDRIILRKVGVGEERRCPHVPSFRNGVLLDIKVP
jgi:hypothetical protein